MLKVGLSSENVVCLINILNEWVIRQKNLNSLQSLIISEWKLLEWDIPELDVLTDVLLKRTVDAHLHVSKAAEQVVEG